MIKARWLSFAGLMARSAVGSGRGASLTLPSKTSGDASEQFVIGCRIRRGAANNGSLECSREVPRVNVLAHTLEP